jgi:hypothetical protein
MEHRPVDEYILEDEWFQAVRDLIRARNHLDEMKELRRFWANHSRALANKVDTDTDLGVEEANEISPIPVDYEPVEPNAPETP